MAVSQIDLLNRAGELADQLAKGSEPVKANTLRSMVADFMSSPDPDPVKLRRTFRLLNKGSGGHLLRSGSFPDQAKVVIRVLDGFLERSDLQPRELKTLFGWTARLLLTRAEKRKKWGPPGKGPGGPKKPTGPATNIVVRTGQPETVVWKDALLSWEPGKGELKAVHEAHQASVQGRGLLDSLPEESKNLLTRKKRRKPIRCEVTVLKRGESWFEIVGLRKAD